MKEGYIDQPLKRKMCEDDFPLYLVLRQILAGGLMIQDVQKLNL